MKNFILKILSIFISLLLIGCSSLKNDNIEEDKMYKYLRKGLTKSQLDKKSLIPEKNQKKTLLNNITDKVKELEKKNKDLDSNILLLEKTKEEQAKEIAILEEKIKTKDSKLKEIEKQEDYKQSIQVQFNSIRSFSELDIFISKNKSFNLTLVKQKINDIAKLHKKIDLQFLNNYLETTNNEEEIKNLIKELERI
ncbi:hypothetical protein N5912_02525 [Arcobacter lacus]|uniref:hypothetical protein n=1 Tax=Arcobacter lacus TaxID=1912876 RepID=UPI0021BA4788|nr:hypothetical protein [Arcobacter lacus]MCT7910694.1 hypothetical protein [Arcobacter lacus]